jgi:hypothetical protein
VRQPKPLNWVWHGAGEGISPLCGLIGVVPCRTDIPAVQIFLPYSYSCRTDIEVEPSIVRPGFANSSKLSKGDFIHH